MEKKENDELIAKVKNKLYESALYLGKKVLDNALNAIYDSLDCEECSLWTINHNSTREGAPDFVSTSVICRKDRTDFNFTKDSSFVHPLRGTLFDAVVNSEKEPKPYYVFHSEDPIFTLHITQDFINWANLKEIVIIPITDKDEKIVALQEISFSRHTYDNSVWDVLSEMVPSFYRSAYERYLLIQKHKLMDRLIKVHGSYKNESVEFLFDGIRRLIDEFCPSQGASYFMWDNLHNRYRLVATSGLEPHGSSEVYYEMGEGITGWMGTRSKPFITDNIQKETVGNHSVGKYREVEEDSETKAMYIPIISPSSKETVIGVFRLVNKQNLLRKATVDYFNDIDADLMKYASKYLALVIDRYQREDEQMGFISKLAHEFKTPANAIYKTACGIKEHFNEPLFMERLFEEYLDGIIGYSQIQKWQAESTLYLARKGKASYNNQWCSLLDVLKKSREVAIPIARDYNVPFSKIVISPFDPNLQLFIDEDAFVIVFYNLLTNAIKYRDKDNPDSFSVIISCYDTTGTIRILVQDYGIGIVTEERESIFEMGFRGSNAITKEASGFGVGLSVVKRIVEDYGGKISIENFKSPTQFVITLPKIVKDNN